VNLNPVSLCVQCPISTTEVGPTGGGRESLPVLARVCVALVSSRVAGGD
jgi:hypothetical protein